MEHKDEDVNNDITQHDDVNQLDDEEQFMVNEINREADQVINDNVIAGEEVDSLRSDDDEGCEEGNVISRLIPRPLTSYHPNKYEKEHQYLLSNKQTDTILDNDISRCYLGITLKGVFKLFISKV